MLWLLILGFGAAVLAHTAPFPFLLERFAPSRALWRVPPVPGPPRVYLTFDDGPNPTATPALLDVLREQGARATFFLIDRYLDETTAPIVRRMFAEGHAVALHTDTRAHLLAHPDDLAVHLRRNAARIERLAGGRPCRLFRPHAGWRSGAMYEALDRIDYRLVGWSWGLWDWNWYRKPDAAALAERIARRAGPGDIIVLHDGHHRDGRADRAHTVEATRLLTAALLRRGYAFGVLCEAGAGTES